MNTAHLDLFGTVPGNRRSIGAHQNNGTGQDEWLTPPHVLAALGPFDLDPCASMNRPWPTAEHHYTAKDNGLVQQWGGLIWCNPPYSTCAPWLARMATHRNGIALVPARTETKTFHDHVWPHADLLLFLRGRLHFHHSDGRPSRENSGAPSVLIAYGPLAVHRLRSCLLPGQIVIPDRGLRV